MIYLDTSAAAKVLIEEAESTFMRQMFADGTAFVSSQLLAVELHAVADRRLVSVDAVQQLLDRVALVSVDDDTLSDAIALHSGLRTLDALHLSTALHIKDALVGVLTFDKELRRAAEQHGLHVAATG